MPQCGRGSQVTSQTNAKDGPTHTLFCFQAHPSLRNQHSLLLAGQEFLFLAQVGGYFQGGHKSMPRGEPLPQPDCSPASLYTQPPAVGVQWGWSAPLQEQAKLIGNASPSNLPSRLFRDGQIQLQQIDRSFPVHHLETLLVGGEQTVCKARFRYSQVPDSNNHFKKEKLKTLKPTHLHSDRDRKEQTVTLILCQTLVLCTNVRNQKYIVYSFVLSKILCNRPCYLLETQGRS